jgi:hypothetical protein
MQITPSLNVTPFLKGQAFQPETIEAMGIAYENVCKSLKLGRSSQLSELIAAQAYRMARDYVGADAQPFVLTVAWLLCEMPGTSICMHAAPLTPRGSRTSHLRGR